MNRGISILIPVYNWDIRPMVFVLHQQGIDCGLPFEIICMDDASDKFKSVNEGMCNLPYVKYFALDQNVGRSKIRNLLASKASYDYFLFLDCDSGIPEHFLKRYVSLITKKQNVEIAVGGRRYKKSKPSSESILHWKYGKKRECDRLFHSNQFKSNNFLIAQSLFGQIRFEEHIEGYGHEDTLFGLQIKSLGKKIHTVKAPVVHLELKEGKRFIADSRSAVRNAYQLWLNREKYPSVEKSIRLLKSFERLKRWNMTGFMAKRFMFKYKEMEQRIVQTNSLHRFDEYRLGYLCYLHHKKSGRKHL